ncbi:MAG: AAA family ATPase [Puniceicoccales bacterium]|jgi:hypothetical protein|nr:AAA family ATPase [Puniceicoccales bacterium]
MRRRAIEILRQWKANPEKKPMILHGARQVGKTWLMMEFGKTEYKNTAYVNFDGNPRMEILIQLEGYVIPIEVKAAKNLQAKSLKFYRDAFAPEKAARLSLADCRIDGGLYNIPLYMAGKVRNILLMSLEMDR